MRPLHIYIETSVFGFNFDIVTPEEVILYE